MRSKLPSWLVILIVSFLLVPVVLMESRSGAANRAENDNLALLLGEAGEQYQIYGTGGIRVSGGHHGFWASNMKKSAVEIDGSGIAARSFSAVNTGADFTAAANGAYFVTRSSICTFPSAAALAGQEIVVCNATGGGTITYQAAPGEALPVGSQGGALTNASVGKVDRFISDGKTWYRE